MARLDLFSEATLEAEALPWIDGFVAFNGSRGVSISRFVPVSSSFAFHVTMQQSNRSMGYIFAKCDQTGSRFYSLYSSSFGAVYFYYRSPGSATVHNVMWSAALNDGRTHTVDLYVEHQAALLAVDGTSLGSHTLVGLVDDCGNAPPECQLLVGKRAAVMTDGVFFFEGLMHNATLVFNQAV